MQFNFKACEERDLAPMSLAGKESHRPHFKVVNARLFPLPMSAKRHSPFGPTVLEIEHTLQT